MFSPDVTQETGWRTKNILSICKGSKFLTSTPIKKKVDNELEPIWPSPVISCGTTAVSGFPEHKSIIDRHKRLAPQMVIMDSDEEDKFQKKKFLLNHKPKKIKVQEQDRNERVASINNDCPVNHLAENGEILLQKNAARIENSSFEKRSVRLQNTLLRVQHDGKKCNLSKPNNQESKSYEKPASNNKIKRASSRRKKVPTIVDSDKNGIMAKTVEVTAPLTLLENQHRKNINLETSTRLSETTQDLEPEMPGGVLEEHTTSIRADGRELMLRRSNRKRYPPLEYWNGERMKISWSPEPCFHKNTTQKELNKSSSDKQVLKIDHPSQKNSTQNWQISHNPKKRSAMTDEKNELDIPGAKEKRTIKSERNIKFFTINSGITIIGPTIAENLKTDWLVNFTKMDLSKAHLPDSEGCLIFNGLVLDQGTTSTGMMLLAPKSINQSDAPNLHNLIFCVMTGTVRVLTDKASGQVKEYSQFTVPCGVTYTIENSSTRKAVLSFVMVPCNARK